MSSQEATYSADVVIIGAGASGLAAAHRLREHNLKVIVLEARERIGGRIHSIKPDGFQYPIELGAEFIHGNAPEVWELLAKAGVRAVESSKEHFKAGLRFTRLRDYYGQIVLVFDALGACVASRDSDLSYGEFAADLLKKDPSFAKPLETTSSYLLGLMATAPEHLSLQYLEQGDASSEQLGTSDYRVLDGYASICAVLAGGGATKLDLHLRTAVERVEWNPHSVRIAAVQDGRNLIYECAQTIITVPPALLDPEKKANGTIVFEPELSNKIEASRLLPMAQVTKVVVECSYMFWENIKADNQFMDFGFIHCDEAPIPTWWSQYPVFSSILTGWATDKRSTALHQSSARLRTAVIDSLWQVFKIPRHEIETIVTDVHSYDWNSDPFSRGAYSYRLVSGNDAADVLREPVADTLFFAGEALNNHGCSGTVHGAIQTGYESAHELAMARAASNFSAADRTTTGK